jgi:UDP-N-acetylmuramoyl-L-alanyl-D-glutamate--2,6-diaminopimelate ligase
MNVQLEHLLQAIFGLARQAAPPASTPSALGVGSINPEITGLQLDSRQTQAGDCFLAFPGLSVDGRDYIEAAIAAGAAAVLYEAQGSGEVKATIPCVAVDNLVAKVGLLARAFYGNPGERMHITGITGTNGKTSISHFLAQAYELLGKKSAVMGTLGVGLLAQLQKTGMTTPDAVTVQHSLAELRDQSVQYLAMEVSSHALAQHRVAGVPIKTAVYTQLSPDHLDFHRDMEDYARCKEQLFQFDSLQHGIINADDAWGQRWIATYRDHLPIIAYSLQQDERDLPTVRCASYQSLPGGAGYQLQLSTPWGSGEVEVHLLGEFNIANVLAVVATLGAQGVNWADIQGLLPKLTAVPGRLQWFRHPSGPALIVDFAHTPDALDQVLQTLRPLCQGKLHCVFGCGGDRDASKRPLMGAVAAKWADCIWLTNDNPRSEDPQLIADSIRKGCGEHDSVVMELDREKAIRSALTVAGKHDMILVAGKGHEAEQIVGEKRLVFSDIDCVRSLCRP